MTRSTALAPTTAIADAERDRPRTARASRLTDATPVITSRTGRRTRPASVRACSANVSAISPVMCSPCGSTNRMKGTAPGVSVTAVGIRSAFMPRAASLLGADQALYSNLIFFNEVRRVVLGRCPSMDLVDQLADVRLPIGGP